MRGNLFSHPLNGKQIKQAIYLSGVGGDYQVHHDILGEAIICYVPIASMGHAIVRELRLLAGEKAEAIKDKRRSKR